MQDLEYRMSLEVYIHYAGVVTVLLLRWMICICSFHVKDNIDLLIEFIEKTNKKICEKNIY